MIANPRGLEQSWSPPRYYKANGLIEIDQAICDLWRVCLTVRGQKPLIQSRGHDNREGPNGLRKELIGAVSTDRIS